MKSPATTQLNRCMNKLVQRIEMVGQQLKPDNKVGCVHIFLKNSFTVLCPPRNVSLQGQSVNPSIRPLQKAALLC
jgi:hypothetical protein